MVDALRVSMSSNSIQPPNQIMQQKMEMKQTEAAEKVSRKLYFQLHVRYDCISS